MEKRNSYSVATNKTTNMNMVCSCGQHKGKGSSNPHDLALMYNWFRTFREKRPEWNRNEWNMQEYLHSYEAAHGTLGKNEFLYTTGRFQNYAN